MQATMEAIGLDDPSSVFPFDCKDVAGKTPLWYASRNGHALTVQLLLQSGADPLQSASSPADDSTTKATFSPLHAAAMSGSRACVQYIIGALPSADDLPAALFLASNLDSSNLVAAEPVIPSEAARGAGHDSLAAWMESLELSIDNPATEPAANDDS